MATFLIDPGVTFLNHGSFGATPDEVLLEQARWQRELEREPVDFLVRRLPGLLTGLRIRAGRFLGADPEALAFLSNATTAVNAVLASLELEPGDELACTDHGYRAVRLAMERRARRSGARVVEARLPFPLEDPEQLVAAVTGALSPRTRLLVIDAVTSPTALVLPVERIISLARERGVKVLVDGAHAPGQLAVDLENMGADWWVGNLHKWVCAPKGTALLWSSQAEQGRTLPLVASHGSGQGYRMEFDWPGTFDPSPWLAASLAMDLHEAMGGPELRAAHHALVQRGREVVASAIGRPLPHPDDPRLYAAMASIPLGIPEEHCLPLNRHLYERHRVEVPLSPLNGEAVLRISGFAAYNKPEHYERLAAVLPAALRLVANA